MKITLLLTLVISSLTLSAQTDSTKHRFFEKTVPTSNELHIGIEYAELVQNSFKNVGPENYTFVVGQRFGKTRPKLGWRYMVINAELSTEHIQNTNEVAFIEGNRVDLAGDVHAQRYCVDYYPVTWGVGYLEKVDRHVLTVSPVLYGAAGYNSWGFANTKYDESYRLKAVTVGGGLRLQSVIMGVLFIENPLFDLFTYAIKNRSVGGVIGDTQITRPEYFGIFGWATIGVKIKI